MNIHDIRARIRRTARPERAAAGAGRAEGFTLIELLVVISLIMILSSVAMSAYRNSVIAAKEAALKSDLFHMRDAIDQGRFQQRRCRRADDCTNNFSKTFRRQSALGAPSHSCVTLPAVA